MRKKSRHEMRTRLYDFERRRLGGVTFCLHFFETITFIPGDAVNPIPSQNSETRGSEHGERNESETEASDKK